MSLQYLYKTKKCKKYFKLGNTSALFLSYFNLCLHQKWIVLSLSRCYIKLICAVTPPLMPQMIFRDNWNLHTLKRKAEKWRSFENIIKFDECLQILYKNTHERFLTYFLDYTFSTIWAPHNVYVLVHCIVMLDDVTSHVYFP